jgi:hypothetical protein
MSELITPVRIAKGNKTYIMRTIGECLTLGMTHLSLEFEGSYIDLKWIVPDKKYIGFGSIGSIKGDDIAEELNTIYSGLKQSTQFIADHFQYIRIG